MNEKSNPLSFVTSLFLSVCIIFVAAFGAAKTAQAEGFALYEWSARGVALGGSVMARKPDPSTIAYNPAQLTRLPGTQIMGGISAVIPRGKVTAFDPVENRKIVTHARARTWLVPHFYMTHELSDKVTLGFGQFTRFGLGFEYDHDWPGRFNIYGVDLQTISWNPSVGVKLTDDLSIGAGVELMYVNLDIKSRSKVPLGPVGNMELDSNIKNAEDFGIGFNLGLHYKFNDQWAIGLAYRSPVKVHAWGDQRFTNMGTTPSQGMPGGYTDAAADKAMNSNFKDGKAHSHVRLPESISGGISWYPWEDFSIEVGATWTKWSNFRELKIHLPNQNDPQTSSKDWKNSWRFNAGIEYDMLDWLTLRGGYVYDRSPMTDRYQDYLVPTSERHIYSTGVGLHFDNWDVDLTYAYIQIEGRNYDQDLERGVLSSHTRGADSHIGSVSLTYKF